MSGNGRNEMNLNQLNQMNQLNKIKTSKLSIRKPVERVELKLITDFSRPCSFHRMSNKNFFGFWPNLSRNFYWTRGFHRMIYNNDIFHFKQKSTCQWSKFLSKFRHFRVSGPSWALFWAFFREPDFSRTCEFRRMMNKNELFHFKDKNQWLKFSSNFKKKTFVDP